MNRFIRYTDRKTGTFTIHEYSEKEVVEVFGRDNAAALAAGAVLAIGTDNVVDLDAFFVARFNA